MPGSIVYTNKLLSSVATTNIGFPGLMTATTRRQKHQKCQIGDSGSLECV